MGIVLGKNQFETREKSIINYINYYNQKRITVKIKGLSPYMYRQQSYKSVTISVILKHCSTELSTKSGGFSFSGITLIF